MEANMLNVIKNGALIIGLAVLALSPLCQAASTDESEIRDQAKAYETAFAAGDSAKLASMFAENARMTDPEGYVIKGRPAIEKYYQESFKRFGLVPIKITVDSLTFPAPNVALEEGTFAVRRLGRPEVLSGYLAVHMKDATGWHMLNVSDAAISVYDRNTRLKDLSWLIGDWVTAGSGPPVRISAKWDAGKNFIFCTMTPQAASAPTSTQVIGWFPSNNTIASWHFQSGGGVGKSIWNKSGSDWVIEGSSTEQDGSMSSATYVLHPTSADSYTWQSNFRTVNGEALPDVPPLKIVRESAAVGSAK